MRRVTVGILTTLAAVFEVASFASTLDVRVLASDGAAVPGVAVLVTRLGPQARPAAPVEARVGQFDLQFQPRLTIVPVGSSVAFPNTDSVSHQVYSFSPARRFQLPLYRGEAHAPVRFDLPGLVALGCNIHDSMVGYILVTTAGHYGITDASGALRLTQIEAGDHEVSVWHPRLRERSQPPSQRVGIAPDAPARVDIRLGDSLKPAPGASRATQWDY